MTWAERATGTGSSASAAETRRRRDQRLAGGQAVANGGDVSSAAGAQAIVKSAIDAFGRVDVLVNNAGILQATRLPSRWTSPCGTSSWPYTSSGTFLVSQALRKAGGGAEGSGAAS